MSNAPVPVFSHMVPPRILPNLKQRIVHQGGDASAELALPIASPLHASGWLPGKKGAVSPLTLIGTPAVQIIMLVVITELTA